MSTYQNPANGHTEEVGFGAFFLTFLFGPIYPVINGLWGVAVVIVVIDSTWWLSMGQPGTILVFITHLVTASFTPSAMRRMYLNRGWIAVDEVPITVAPVPSMNPLTAALTPTTAGAASDTKQCPFCAETIKAAAVKCRYCQSDLPAVKDASSIRRETICGKCRAKIAPREESCASCGAPRLS